MQRKPILGIFLFSLACVLLIAALAAVVWINAHPQPAEVGESLFQGIDYTREVRQSPRPMVIHIVTVDLRQPGISFLVTPGDPKVELPLKARTTSRFLEEFGVQVAINGDGFTPWYSNSLLDYYPHPGEPVDPTGFAASRGIAYSELTDDEPVLYISRTNQARFKSPIGKIYNAISGNLVLVEQGKPVSGLEGEAQPRTAIALDQRGRRMILVAVDGRQTGYSEGATLVELAEIIIANGGYTAMNLDGGGSSTLVKASGSGKAIVLNSPIDNQIRGKERAVGNHLGIYANPILNR